MAYSNRFFAPAALRGVIACVVGVATMAMTPAPALANSSAAASADIAAPVREQAQTPVVQPVGEGDATYQNLFANWKKLEGDKRGVGASSVPSRMPVDSARFSSDYGMRVHPVSGRRKMHDGIDMAAPAGTPIYATADGRVEMAQWYGGYGNFVELAHGGQMTTRYGHMSKINVRPGQDVRKGDLIGFVGSTGRSTGPHLHYEVRVAGEAVDPEPYLHADTFQEAFAEATAGMGAGGPE